MSEQRACLAMLERGAPAHALVAPLGDELRALRLRP